MSPITEAEREAAVQLLQSRREMFLAAVAGLGQEHWQFKPDAERWSIAEIAEHLIAVETLVMTLIPRVLTEEPITETLENNDIPLQTRVAGRRSKVQAAEMVRPKGRWQNGEELIAAFSEARSKTITYTRGTQDDLRHHAGPHPTLGLMDGYQWLLFLGAHAERHVAQIRELQGMSGYPATEKVDSA
ncbi:MAG TPA: DinB family protein [Candidatus Angelobacter sp.]